MPFSSLSDGAYYVRVFCSVGINLHHCRLEIVSVQELNFKVTERRENRPAVERRSNRPRMLDYCAYETREKDITYLVARS